MKTLYIIRHGKSSHDEIYKSDLNRPLLKKGEERTKLIAQFLKDNAYTCQLILSSNAVRAMETARIIEKSFGDLEYEIVDEPRLYLAKAADYFEILFELDETISEVAIVAHNPAVMDFANNFLSEKLENMPTSTVVCIEINTDKWSEILIAPYAKRFLITFKML